MSGWRQFVRSRCRRTRSLSGASRGRPQIKDLGALAGGFARCGSAAGCAACLRNHVCCCRSRCGASRSLARGANDYRRHRYGSGRANADRSNAGDANATTRSHGSGRARCVGHVSNGHRCGWNRRSGSAIELHARRLTRADGHARSNYTVVERAETYLPSKTTMRVVSPCESRAKSVPTTPATPVGVRIWKLALGFTSFTALARTRP